MAIVPPAVSETGAAHRVRTQVRAFLAEARPPSTCDSWLRAFDPVFSAELGRRGWLGMMVPRRFGGGGLGYAERYVVTEELLAAGAPVAYHWFADRQVAPTLLSSGNTRLQDELLPAICRGELCVCIGISEPNAGSDVSAISTSARPVGDRWVIDGQKVWTTGAMHAQFCHVVARSERVEGRPHRGLTEFLVPMDSPGVTVRPIEDLAGEAHFAEIFFDNVEVEGWRLLGTPGDGFRQIAKQLDFERSGPERFTSTLPLLWALLACVRRERDRLEPALVEAVGELSSRLAALRALSFAVAEAMDQGDPPSAEAALVKDLGAVFEQDVITVARDVHEELDQDATPELGERLREALLYQATFTLRGGTAEVLREIVARRMLDLGRSA